jgi:beta-N-acetylhexosaminidase
MITGQRIGQLFLMGLEANRLGQAELAAIRDQHVGSVWFTTRTTLGVAGVRRTTDAIQAEATEAATARVRFFVAANQEGGLIQALRGPGFAVIPSAMDQGKLAPATLERNALTWGREMADGGVNLDFAPVFDVVPPGGEATNQPIGVLRREYGSDPATAGDHAAAVVRGLTRAGVATTAKHFPGLGRVVGNTDDTADVVDDVTTATDPYLASFRTGIAAGVPFVMVALATYTRIDPDHLAAFSPLVIEGLLRRDLGFTGVVMSDDLGVAAAVATIPAGRRAVDFLLAGGDFVVSKTAEVTVAMVEAVTARAEVDPTFASRVDEAALRILEAKAVAGLLPCPT